MAHFTVELRFENGAPLNMSKSWPTDGEAFNHGVGLRAEWPDAIFIQVREGLRIVYGTTLNPTRTDQDQAAAGERLDEALDESFPASDPVAVSHVN